MMVFIVRDLEAENVVAFILCDVVIGDTEYFTYSCMRL